ncbi:hypothetical protein [Streptosporangium sp. NPDC002721]|uniref:hypothetical protein n=1 Tax=Streptosporangium sp. NPDC002721 TaxID=3366188 RepID=UPI0036C7CCEF
MYEKASDAIPPAGVSPSRLTVVRPAGYAAISPDQLAPYTRAGIVTWQAGAFLRAQPDAFARAQDAYELALTGVLKRSRPGGPETVAAQVLADAQANIFLGGDPAWGRGTGRELRLGGLPAYRMDATGSYRDARKRGYHFTSLRVTVVAVDTGEARMPVAVFGTFDNLDPRATETMIESIRAR